MSVQPEENDLDGTDERVQSAFISLLRLASRPSTRAAFLGTSELSMTDAWLLRYIAETGPTRLSDLAKWHDVDRSTMTTQVRRLEKAELVQREVDPSDGRAFLVAVTDSGHDTLERNVRATQAEFAEILKNWTPTKRRALADSLERLVSGITDRQDSAPRTSSKS